MTYAHIFSLIEVFRNSNTIVRYDENYSMKNKILLGIESI